MHHVLLTGSLVYFSYGISHSFQPGYHDNISIGDLHTKSRSWSDRDDEVIVDGEQEMTVLLADTEDETDD